MPRLESRQPSRAKLARQATAVSLAAAITAVSWLAWLPWHGAKQYFPEMDTYQGPRPGRGKSSHWR